MDINEAYKETLNVVEELKNSGIKTEINDFINSEAFKESELPKDKWKMVEFYLEKDEEMQKIFDSQKISTARKSLFDKGICFDTSFGEDDISWELDFSFHLDKEVFNE